MALIARNRVTVPANYSEEATIRTDPNTPLDKFTMFVQANGIMMQVSTHVPPTFEDSGLNEMEILTGFSIRSFKEPVYGFRFRSVAGSSTVTFVAQ